MSWQITLAGWLILNRRPLRPMPSPLVITIHRNGAIFRENPRRGSPDNLAGTAARQPRRLSAAMTEPGGHCTEHWHAARRGTKMLGRHGTQASNSAQNSRLTAPRCSLLIIDGRHAVGQTGCLKSGRLNHPETRVAATDAQDSHRHHCPWSPDSSPIEKFWPLWLATVSAENADDAVSTRLRAD